MGAAVCGMDVACSENAGNENFTDYIPLEQGGGTLHWDADAIEQRRVMFLAAAYESHLLAGDRLLGDTEGEYSVNNAFDLGRNRIPVERHGIDDSVSIKDMGRYDDDIVVK